MNRALILGDSNVVLFRELHQQAGYGHWRPGADNPPASQTEFPAHSTVPMQWTRHASHDDAPARLHLIEAFAFIASTAMGLSQKPESGGRIRELLAQRREFRPWVVFMFGHCDLDFALWYKFSKQRREPRQIVDEMTGRYMDFIHDTVGDDYPVSVLGVHPVTIQDHVMLEFLLQYDLLPSWAPRDDTHDFLRACGEARYESRVALRRQFNRNLQQQCLRRGYRFTDITSHLCDGTQLKDEYRLPDSPMDVHVYLQRVLPLWLRALDLPDAGGT